MTTATQTTATLDVLSFFPLLTGISTSERCSVSENFLHPLTTLKKRKFNFESFGWRMSCQYCYIFTNMLKSVQNLFIWAFSNYSQKTLSCTLSHSIHILIKCVFFLSFCVVRNILTEVLICELNGSNSNVSTHFYYCMLKQYYSDNQRFSSALQRDVLYVPQRDFPNWIW